MHGKMRKQNAWSDAATSCFLAAMNTTEEEHITLCDCISCHLRDMLSFSHSCPSGVDLRCRAEALFASRRLFISWL